MAIENNSICCQNQGRTNNGDISDIVPSSENGGNSKEEKSNGYANEILLGLNRVIELYKNDYYIDNWVYKGPIVNDIGHRFEANVKHTSNNGVNTYEIVGKIILDVCCNPNCYKVKFSKYNGNDVHATTQGDNYKNFSRIVNIKEASEKDYEKALVAFEKCINKDNHTGTVGNDSYLFGVLYQHFRGKRYEKLNGKELYNISDNKVPYDKSLLIKHLHKKKEYLSYLSETIYKEYIPSSSHTGPQYEYKTVIKEPAETRLVLRCGEKDLITWTCKSVAGGFKDCHLLIKGDSV